MFPCTTRCLCSHPQRHGLQLSHTRSSSLFHQQVRGVTCSGKNVSLWPQREGSLFSKGYKVQEARKPPAEIDNFVGSQPEVIPGKGEGLWKGFRVGTAQALPYEFRDHAQIYFHLCELYFTAKQKDIMSFAKVRPGWKSCSSHLSATVTLKKAPHL